MAKATASKRGAIKLPDTDIFGASLTAGSGPLKLDFETIEPDPNQARWVLPPDLRAKLIARKLSPVEALKQWQKQVERLVARAQKTGLRVDKLPELHKLNEIKALAESIRAGGQVNPITVTHLVDGRWRIETGERRYWAHVWLVGVEGHEEDRKIPATAQPKIDPVRQAVENLHASPLNSIGLAREVARLLMTLDGSSALGPDSKVLDLAAYREVASQRVSLALWKKVEAVMGLSSEQLGRNLRLLKLAEEAVVVADRNDLSEKLLRPVVSLETPEAQTRIVQLAADLQLTADDVDWLCRQPDLDEAERELRARLLTKQPADEKGTRAQHKPEQILYNRVVSFSRFIERARLGGTEPAQAIAEQYCQHRGPTAQGELQELIEVLEGALTKVNEVQAEQAAPEFPEGEVSAPGRKLEDVVEAGS